MSTEQVDPQLIEQTRQQIRGLVQEIQALAKQELTTKEFYGEFLNRVVSALAAIGGAVWTLQDNGQFDLQYQISLHDTKLPENPENYQRHGRLLQKIATSGQPALVAPKSGEGDGDQAGNPTDFLLVLAPVKVNDNVKSVVEVFQRPNARPMTQRGYLRFLVQMCELVADYLKTHELRHFTDRQTLWNQLETFTRNVHASLDPREAAYTIANEGRRLIECDRVSVAIKHGNKCKIEAVSGQDTFDKRSNTVQLLGKLATAVVATGEPMWYSGDTTDMAPQVEDAVQAYVDDCHSKNVAVLPLTRSVKAVDETAEDKNETIGAIIVEQIENARLREGMVQRVEVVSEHSSVAMANALEHNSLFLMPLWRAIGKSKWIVTGRTLPKTIAISAAVLAAILAMIFVPYDFNLQGKGTLEPVIQRDVFATQDGTVDELYVKHGDRVKEGQVLLKLRNVNLDVALEQVQGELRTTQASLNAAQRQRQEGRATMSAQERNRVDGEVASLSQKLTSLNEQLRLHQEKQKQMEVKSPIDGIVTTWQLRELLLRRPVKQSQTLLSVADDTGDWEIDVHMPEDRMGHIRKAQKELGDELPVSFILATNPGHPFQGTVREMHKAAEVKGEEGNIVSVKVKMNKADLQAQGMELRQGAEVTSKVYCGRRAIGYVWFHDLIGFIQSRILFRF